MEIDFNSILLKQLSEKSIERVKELLQLSKGYLEKKDHMERFYIKGDRFKIVGIVRKEGKKLIAIVTNVQEESVLINRNIN